MGVFEYFRQNPEAGAVFNQAVTSWSIQAADAVAGSYDFSGFGTVVDVGGSQGTLLAAILRSYPAARGILLDNGDRPCISFAGLTLDDTIGKEVLRASGVGSGGPRKQGRDLTAR